MRARVFLVVFLAVLMVPGVAHAKGPDQATIDGAGMAAPMSFEGTEGSLDDLSTLADVSGLWPAVYTQTPDPMLPEAPKEELGSKLVITWRLPDGGPKPGFVRQDLYLHAEGGPLTYTPPDQSVPGGGSTTGGWFRTPTALQPRWDTLGLPTKSKLEGATSPAKPAAPPATSEASGGLELWPGIAVIAVAALVVVGSRMTLGRRVRVGST
jgi:hypothetical protein